MNQGADFRDLSGYRQRNVWPTSLIKSIETLDCRFLKPFMASEFAAEN